MIESHKLRYIIHHVFLPPKLPQGDDSDIQNDAALIDEITRVITEYQKFSHGQEHARWTWMLRMLCNLKDTTKSQFLSLSEVKSCILSMLPKDVVSFWIRAQNAAITIRKDECDVIFESYEVSPQTSAVMAAAGKLVCSYPGPAMQIPRETAEDDQFCTELARFLTGMNQDVLDTAATSRKAGATVIEERDTADPRYITHFLMAVLHGVGGEADVPRISKRIADDVLWDNVKLPWRRSPLWLIIRVTLQTSLHRETDDHHEYKTFMVFLMAKLVQLAAERDLESDILFCMRAKMSRRLMKMGSTIPDFVIRAVEQATDVVEGILQGRWQDIQQAHTRRPVWAPETLDVTNDTLLSLNNSRGYLTEVLDTKFYCDPQKQFAPNHHPRIRDIDQFLIPTGAEILVEAYKSDPHLALVDFEFAVQNDLNNWTTRNLYIESFCSPIAECMEEYSALALSLYKERPEDLSIMLLTLAELWVAMDKIVVTNCPLIKEYSPEVSLTLFDVLLLRRSGDLERLARVQSYLRDRHDAATPGQSIFSNDANSTAFAVRFFETSERHQDLERCIESRAAQDRKRTKEDLIYQSQCYETLSREAELLDHSYINRVNGRVDHNWRICSKCSLERRVRDLVIDLHEWPLPQDPFKAKIVVFELDCPLAFNIWRSATYSFLCDVCLPTADRPEQRARPFVQLEGSPVLREFMAKSGRITLASKTKSFVSSHYSSTHIPAPVDRVCVNSGLQFELYDNANDLWAAQPFIRCRAAQHCTFKLSKGPYATLQYALEGTLHPSNQVIANQEDCHRDLGLHEFIAFGTLRSGGLLQWLNILKELRARSLNFRREEVLMLLMQSAWQVGPVSVDDESCREWHVDLKHPEFGTKLLLELKEMLLSIKENWLEGMAMKAVIMLTSRLLTSAVDPGVTHLAYSLLRQARDICLSWTTTLSRKLRESTGDKNVEEYQYLLREAAITCRSTYDVEPPHIQHLLNTPEDVRTLILCGIFIFDNSSLAINASASRSVSQRYFERDQRLSYHLEQDVRRLIQANRQGLDEALQTIWPSYRPGASWHELHQPNERWLSSSTAKSGSQESQMVHINILEGRLLIDGKPLGRLPVEIVKHRTYQRIFGDKIFCIIPSDIAGMDFASRDLICNTQIYFTLRATNGELIIQGKGHNETLQLIPCDKFLQDLPSSLIDGHTHWLNLSTSELEIRPIARLWEPSARNWHMQFSPSGQSKMLKEDSVLVDIRSPSHIMVAEHLSPLEYSENIVVTRSSLESQCLLVDLPRFALSFFVNKANQLESANLRDMIVDDNQSVGSLYGLKNQLVLRSSMSIFHDLPPSRCVLIPEGDITFQPDGHHVSVQIDTKSKERVRIHQYKIDADLNCLVGNVHLFNKLYMIYLHAVTGHCLPDPLTGRTGTEEALTLLRSAGCFSFQRLEPLEVSLLRQIACLTPQRQYYPLHLKSMQQVQWTTLTSVAQHYGFQIVAQSILDYGGTLSKFYPSDENGFGIAHSVHEAHLLERAARRQVILYPAEFNDLLPDTKADMRYQSRDSVTSGDAYIGRHVSQVANWINAWTSQLPSGLQLFEIFQKWVHLDGVTTDYNPLYRAFWFEPKFSEVWLSLQNWCHQRSRRDQRYQLMFVLCPWAYGSPRNQQLVTTMLALATNSRLQLDAPSLPTSISYDLSIGCEPQEYQISKYLQSHRRFHGSPEANLIAQSGEDKETLARRRSTSFQSQCQQYEATMTQDIMRQWPCAKPRQLAADYSSHYDLQEITDKVNSYFSNCHRNHLLRGHIEKFQEILDASNQAENASRDFPEYHPAGLKDTLGSEPSYVLFSHLTQRAAPSIPPQPSFQDPFFYQPRKTYSRSEELEHLFDEFRNSKDAFIQKYSEDLNLSRSALEDESSNDFQDQVFVERQILSRFLDCARRHFCSVLCNIRRSLQPFSPVEKVIYKAGQWPRITMKYLLGQLAFESCDSLPNDWKEAIIHLAKSYILFQYHRRLVVLVESGKTDDLLKELDKTRDVAPKNCDSFTDWLLVQIEGDFRVRNIQADVALRMISEDCSQNAALQLNMGEGKSSVIIPIVASSLANGKTLVRVVVLKSLATQMFQSLVGRLGGLANRRVFYMPFSRALNPSLEHLRLIQIMYEECMRVGGILIVQPDHMLSYKLMSIDKRLSRADKEGAETLLQSQLWLERHSRDLLDESDEILHVRYQLVYTIGQQNHLEGHPDRWTTVQQIFQLAKRLLPRIIQRYPHGIERQGSQHEAFPPLRISDDRAANEFLRMIAEEVMDGALLNYSFRHFQLSVRESALTYITVRNTPKMDELSSLLKSHCASNGLWKGLLLLRGLLAHKLLLYVLRERRWRVDYGLDLTRTMLAVPYRAKDVPALRAEFGHPDVAIALTCLSYYYGGLEEHQLDICFQLLQKLDNPDLEYDTWIAACDPNKVPDSLRRLSGLNVKSSDQRLHWLALFQMNQNVIDFFLSKVVFPKEAKEFPHRLGMSGWDIAETKAHVTTGFSGTNDNRYLLPLSMQQLDPPHQRSTNAKVLTYLLRPENKLYVQAVTSEGGRLSAQQFIELLASRYPKINVLLDVGAQILELQNEEVAACWLAKMQDAKAAIFFGNNDELCVLSRDGSTESFISSPFNQQLDKCLLYLDDAHTRGADVKLPVGFKAAVTLGPKITKDRLTQGCMRMRRLGNGHSLAFFAPPEVDRKIREAASKDPSAAIEVVDVLRWTMFETCAHIQHHVPHWARQGWEHRTRRNAWDAFSTGEVSSDILSSSWLTQEAQTLEELYGSNSTANHPAWHVPELRRKCLELGISSLSASKMTDEEEERELMHEIEREHQLERPAKLRPAIHTIHEDVRRFIRRGRIPLSTSVIQPAFSTLNGTTASLREASLWQHNLYVTSDFANTVVTRTSLDRLDQYLRPVNWIVSCRDKNGNIILVLMSPHEANFLLPDIRKSMKVCLHVYTPRVMQSMRSCDDLDFYRIPSTPKSRIIPPLLILRLNLFAGQLYFKDRPEYMLVCRFLGILTSDHDGTVEVESDGFIKPEHRVQSDASASESFQESPLPLLRELVGFRRKGMGYLQTHLGKVLHGRFLTDDDFKS